MSKANKYAVNGAAIVGLIKAVLNAKKQFTEIDAGSLRKFDWKELLLETGKGALVGGIGGGLIGAFADHQNSLEKPLDTDSYLYNIARKKKLKKDDATYLRVQEKADVLINLLRRNFSEKLAGEPFRIGSTEKGTALREKFDIDIALSFKKNSFRSTLAMFDSVGDYLEQLIGKYSIVRIRDQHVSIGVYFLINGREFKVDVVPKKRSSVNSRNKSGYLFVNDSTFWKDSSSYTKTNFHALSSIRLTETQKKIIIILKYWKNKNKLPLSSHLLENLVLDAYDVNKYSIPRNLTGKLIMILRHISENLDVAIIRSVENTNNILTDISKDSKSKIINACIRAVEDFEYQPNTIFDNFNQ